MGNRKFIPPGENPLKKIKFDFREIINFGSKLDRMGPGYDKCMGQSCIDEILTVYTLHLDRMEELENNLLQLDIWETETQKILMEKEKLQINTLIKNVSFLTTNVDEELLEVEYMEELALQIREAELWQIEYEFLEIYGIEEVNRWLTTVYEKGSGRIDKLDICVSKKILPWNTPKDRIIPPIYVYLLLNQTLKINENFKIGYHDRYVTT